jgi:ATP adenylyltransferase
MDNIYAPWRMAYIKGKKPEGCILCKNSLRCNDLVLFEGKTAFIIVNRYPYTNGHLMVSPFRHLNRMEDLLPDERTELFNLQVMCLQVLTEAIMPDGFNIGVNLGKASGAGVEDHIHVHIVPRWNGDTNFMSVISNVRVIPEDIHKTCELLQPYFNKYLQEV